MRRLLTNAAFFCVLIAAAISFRLRRRRERKRAARRHAMARRSERWPSVPSLADQDWRNQ